MRDVVIVSAARTPIGSFLGSLSSLSAPQLGSIAIEAAVNRSGISVNDIDDVYMGCVLPAGMGQAPARQAAIGAGLPVSVPCTTVNKVCGSGLKSVLLGISAIATGEADVVIAGGMESMSNAPHLVSRLRQGVKLGQSTMDDHVVLDGLTDAYDNIHMGNCAEICATKHHITREDQDAFAAESYRRAVEAIDSGVFDQEIVPVTIENKKKKTIIATDEEPHRGDINKLSKLRTAFVKEGTVTAGNASSLNDGAAAVVLMSKEAAERNNITPLCHIVSSAQHAQEPVWFTTAPAQSIQSACAKADWTVSDVDLWEINEAFSVVSLVNNQLLDIDPKRINVHGGAVALGHPIGASGTRILVTLLYAMQKQNVKKGGASLCIGGGEGIALLVERL